MSNRESIVKGLSDFYLENFISPKNFVCKKLDGCKQLSANIKLVCGAEAHVGELYGNIAKIVILSLDTGGDVATLDTRTDIIQKVDYNYANPHMKGTIELLMDFFRNENSDEVLKHFAMTNAAKCSNGGDSTNKLSSGVYANCREYHIKEISILEPQIIFAEGVDSIPYGFKFDVIPSNDINDFFINIGCNDLSIRRIFTNALNKYVSIVKIDSGAAYFVRCPHPSARMGQWQAFRDCILPQINYFLRNKIGLLEK